MTYLEGSDGMVRRSYIKANNVLGQRVIELCKEKGISIPELAAMIDVDKSMIYKLVKRKTPTCTLGVLVSLQRGLNVRLVELLKYLTDEEIEHLVNESLKKGEKHE